MKRSSLNDWMTLLAVACVAGIAGATGQAMVSGDGQSIYGVIVDLGGWAAAVATLIVGIATLRPLVSQMAAQERMARRSAENTFADHYLQVQQFSECLDQRTRVYTDRLIIRARYQSAPAPLQTLLSDIEKNKSELNEAAQRLSYMHFPDLLGDGLRAPATRLASGMGNICTALEDLTQTLKRATEANTAEPSDTLSDAYFQIALQADPEVDRAVRRVSAAFDMVAPRLDDFEGEIHQRLTALS